MWILLRHGETQFHHENRYQGQLDTSLLTTLGRMQTEELRDCINQLKIDACFCSPVKRARETESLLRPSLHNVPTQFVQDLREVSIASWEGLLKDDIKKSDPNSLLLWRCIPHIFSDSSGNKPLLQLYARARSFLERQRLETKNNLVIGHDHVNRALIISLLDLPLEAHYALPQAISSMSILQRQNDTGRYSLSVSNLEHENARAKPLSAEPGPRLILIRHGVTNANTARIYQGTDDLGLSDLGIQQIMALEELLKAIKPSLIVSSNLCRALDSVKHLPFSSTIPRYADSRLNEYNYGRWQGLTANEVEIMFPEDISAWRLMSQDKPIPDGESISSLLGRITSVLVDLWERARRGETVVVVAHDIVIRAIITMSLRLGQRQIWGFPISNGAISELCLNPVGFTILKRHNIIPGKLNERYGCTFL